MAIKSLKLRKATMPRGALKLLLPRKAQNMQKVVQQTRLVKQCEFSPQCKEPCAFKANLLVQHAKTTQMWLCRINWEGGPRPLVPPCKNCAYWTGNYLTEFWVSKSKLQLQLTPPQLRQRMSWLSLWGPVSNHISGTPLIVSCKCWYCFTPDFVLNHVCVMDWPGGPGTCAGGWGSEQGGPCCKFSVFDLVSSPIHIIGLRLIFYL